MELDIEILCGPYALFMQDFSNDGEVNLSDLFFLLALLFAPAGGGDWNGDGVVDFLDLVAVAEWVSESTTGEAPSIRLTPTGSKETASRRGLTWHTRQMTARLPLKRALPTSNAF